MMDQMAPHHSPGTFLTVDPVQMLHFFDGSFLSKLDQSVKFSFLDTASSKVLALYLNGC